MKESIYIQTLCDSIEDVHLKPLLSNVLHWYYKRSKRNRISYYTFTTLSLVSVSLIPIFNTFADWEVARVITTAFSSVSIICAGVLAIYNLKDNWLRNRISLENLKQECLFYIEKCGEYSTLDPQAAKEVFILNIKAIVNNESKQWITTLEKDIPLNGLHVQ